MRLLVGLLRPATIWRSFKSFGWKHEMYSESYSSITLEMVLDLWILGRP